MAEQQSSLEWRIRAIEDRLEIYNLIAGHPPSADTGAAAYAEAVYTEDGVFDRGHGLAGATGNKVMGALLQSPGHQAAIAGGLAHFTGLPHVTVEGDTAVVISYLQILTPRKSGEEIEVPNHGASRGYHIHRVVTNRWDLVRTSSGWKIKRRTLRLVDGSEPSRDILRGALETMVVTGLTARQDSAGSSSNLKPTFCRPSSALLPYSCLDLLGERRIVGDRIGLHVGLRHDQNEKAAGLVGDIAEAAVFAARHRDHIERLKHQRMLAAIAPGNLEAAGEAHEILDRVEVAVQAGAVARLAFGDGDDQAARPLDRGAGAAALIIGRRHHRIDLARGDLLHRRRAGCLAWRDFASDRFAAC